MSTQVKPEGDCKTLLAKAFAELKKFEKWADFIAEDQQRHAVVIVSLMDAETNTYEVFDGTMRTQMAVRQTSELAKDELTTGDVVWVAGKEIISRAIVHPIGQWYPVVEASEDGIVKVLIDGQVKEAFGEVDEREEVLLDASKTVVVRSRPVNVKTYAAPIQHISWDDIGGLADAKLALREAIEFPITHAHLYRAYSHRGPKGVMLSGPPGCGKTLLAKAAASAIARMHNSEANTGFIYVKGPELLSKWVGESEAAVRQLFSRARGHYSQHGYPAVLFLDEADALLAARGSGVGVLTSTMVPAFLAEMDGLEDSGAIVVLATNRPQLLDSAVIREGRIDRKIAVTRPERDAVADILTIHSRTLTTSGLDVPQLVTNALWSDNYKLFDFNGVEGHLRHTVSGAMLAGIIAKAKSQALHRDIGLGLGRASGVQSQDVLDAVTLTYNETKLGRLDEIVQELMEARNG